MPTQIAAAEGIHPYWMGSDTPVGVDEAGTRWVVGYKGRNAVLTATFDGGATLEFRIPTDGVNKTGSVAAFTIPNFGNGQWVTHREHVKFEVRFPTPPKVTEVSVNIARQNCTIVSDGSGGLDVYSGMTKVGALPRPWVEYLPDGAVDRQRLWLDWIVAEPMMKLTMPTLTATEWASAVLDPTVITTSTASTATAYSNQRKLDVTSNGVKWAMFWDGTSNTTDSMHFRYSTDGVTWTDGGGFGFAGTGSTYVPNGSFFIDVDDYAHVAYKDRHNGFIYYRRGTPNAGRTAWTWSGSAAVYTGVERNYPDIVAHREGSGWMAHLAVSYADTSCTATYYRLPIASTGTIGAVEGATNVGAIYTNANHTHPSVDFNHTGDGKTVAGGTPHLYVAWSAGATGAGKGIRFKKATYSGGSWTWGTEREIDSTRYINSSSAWLNCMFDGTRVVIPGIVFDGTNSDLILHDRDAADATTTLRTLIDNTAVDGTEFTFAGSASYDSAGNVYILGRHTVTGPTHYVGYRTWTRATATHAWTQVAVTNSSPHVSAKRGYSGSKIEFIYTDGTASPYSVTYDSISLGITQAVTPATETDTAQPVGRRKIKAIGTAVSTETAQPIQARKIRVIGVATETDTAVAVTSRPKVTIALSPAVEVDTALPITPVLIQPAYIFTPPTMIEKRSGDRLFSRYGIPTGMTVTKVNGVYTLTPYPWLGDLVGLTEGVDYFLGGRDYPVPQSIALELEAAGFPATRV